MSTVGGKDVHDKIRNLTRVVLSDSLLVQVTWEGTSDKPKIKHSEVINCFLMAIEGSTTDIIKKFLSSYIRNAPQRMKSSMYLQFSLTNIINSLILQKLLLCLELQKKIT